MKHHQGDLYIWIIFSVVLLIWIVLRFTIFDKAQDPIATGSRIEQALQNFRAQTNQRAWSIASDLFLTIVYLVMAYTSGITLSTGNTLTINFRGATSIMVALLFASSALQKLTTTSRDKLLLLVAEELCSKNKNDPTSRVDTTDKLSH